MLDQLYASVRKELGELEGLMSERLMSGIEVADSISRFVVRNGGKRMRPAIFFLSARACGVQGDGLCEIGAALEMLHAASLLHDDVVDDAAVRRGHKSVRAMWGNQASVLVGDLFWCRALRLFAQNKRDGFVDAVTSAVDKVIEGELLEIAHQNDLKIAPETYMRIIQGKTAALFSLAAEAGAIVSEATASFRNALYSYGFDLGQAFQLADDLLDYVAEGEGFGKATGQDFRAGRITYPLIRALKTARSDEISVMRDAVIAECVTEDHFRAVVEIVVRYGGIEATHNLIFDLTGRAKGHLDIFKSSIYRDALIGIADYVAGGPAHRFSTA